MWAESVVRAPGWDPCGRVRLPGGAVNMAATLGAAWRERPVLDPGPFGDREVGGRLVLPDLVESPGPSWVVSVVLGAAVVFPFSQDGREK